MALTQMYDGKNNSPQTALSANITADDSVIPVSDISVFPSAPNLATIGNDDNAEVIRYTGISGSTLTNCERGFGGTTKKSWDAETVISRQITKYDFDAIQSNITELNTAKQNTYSADATQWDTTPTSGSTNPVTSGGVKTALDNKQNTLTFDSTPTSGSANPVTSGGIYSAFDGLHKIYTSPSELGLSGTPTMVDVAEAMPDGSIGVFATYDIDISALTYNDEVNEVVIFKQSNIRIFAIASRTYNNMDFRNAQLYYASYSNVTHTFFGFKKVINDNLYFQNQSTSVTSASTAEFCNIADSRITTDTVVLNCEFTVPSAITSNVTWTTTAGYISLKGICTSSTCKVNLVLGQKGN